MTDQTRHEVCPVDACPPGERRIVSVDGLSIGVFNVDGTFYALANVCPHHLAPLCEGVLTGEVTSSGVGEYELHRDGEIIQCPWHGWKFDLATGASVDRPRDLGTRTFDVAVEPSASEFQLGCSSSPDTGCEPFGDEDCDPTLVGGEPPVDTYDVAVEREMVVLYL